MGLFFFYWRSFSENFLNVFKPSESVILPVNSNRGILMVICGIVYTVIVATCKAITQINNQC